MASEAEEDKVIEGEADDIAGKISNILISAFKTKEGRDPTNEEIENLFEELTEERINEMLTGVPVIQADCHTADGVDGDGNVEVMVEAGVEETKGEESCQVQKISEVEKEESKRKDVLGAENEDSNKKRKIDEDVLIA